MNSAIVTVDRVEALQCARKHGHDGLSLCAAGPVIDHPEKISLQFARFSHKEASAEENESLCAEMLEMTEEWQAKNGS